MNGSLQLREYPGDIIRLSCEKCGRSGQYRKQKLIERYGADMRLPAGGNRPVRPDEQDARRLHGSLRRFGPLCRTREKSRRLDTIAQTLQSFRFGAE